MLVIIALGYGCYGSWSIEKYFERGFWADLIRALIMSLPSTVMTTILGLSLFSMKPQRAEEYQLSKFQIAI